MASGPAKLGPRLEGLEYRHRQKLFPIRSSPPIFIHIGHGSRSVSIRRLHFHPSTKNFVCYSLLLTLLSGGCALGPVFFPKLSAVPVHSWVRHRPLKLSFSFISFDNLLKSNYCYHFTLQNQKSLYLRSLSLLPLFLRSHPLGRPWSTCRSLSSRDTPPSSSAPTRIRVDKRGTITFHLLPMK